MFKKKKKVTTTTLSDEERSKRHDIINKFELETREEWRRQKFEAIDRFNGTCPHCGHTDIIDRFDYHTPVNHCTKCNHEWKKADTLSVGQEYPFQYNSMAIISLYYYIERIMRDNNFDELKQQIHEDEYIHQLKQAPRCVLESCISAYFGMKWPNARPIRPEMEWNRESWLDYTFPDNIWDVVQQILNT